MPKQIDEDLLIKAAAEVFAERGYAGAGVAEIARRAGVTTGAIYSRYSGKSELLLEALKRSFVLHFGDAIASALSSENRAENFDQDGVGIRSIGRLANDINRKQRDTPGEPKIMWVLGTCPLSKTGMKRVWEKM